MISKKKRGRPPGPAMRQLNVSIPCPLDERVTRQATRLGLPLASYVRQALAQRVEADEATDPNRRTGS